MDETYSDAAIQASAKAIRQLYLALITEGFTGAEAMELIKTMLPKTIKDG